MVYGEGYSTADMVSPGFSSASVASDFYEDTSETYDRFRFKRVNFWRQTMVQSSSILTSTRRKMEKNLKRIKL